MPFINDTVFDSGLSQLSDLTRVDICSQEPATYTEATSTYTLGNKTTTTGAPTNGDVSGRKVVVAAISAGNVTGSGTASHWGGTDGVNTLWAAGALSAPQGVTSGNTFDLGAIDIEINDPA